ncbi:uncharacterized protein LOC134754760 [Cydia strobilella]|uniref:uncharacterized protein LOC134754760 n=1 Tax=Cydia strobilella TaxID=1100964 RepID=UPI003004A15D
MLEKSAVLTNGRWSVGLPWKDPHVTLPDSYPSAFKRLQGVEKKMLADKAYGLRYEKRVNHLFENDFAREMADTSLTPNTWYLPHFGVDNPNKKELRLVYDAAAKSQGKSLNDFLLTGPDLLASLFGIMVRFREDRVAVTGDIKDMFLRIKINPVDQNAIKFLWRGRNPTGPVKTYAMTSLIFGANCSPFIAQYIKNKNASRFESTLPAAVAAIHRQHYMDDYIDSLPDEATAISMVKNIRDIHSAGGFEIRNWTCNSATVLDTIPKDILGNTAVRFGLDEHDEGKRTLGLIWYPAKDELGFDVSFKRIPDSVIKGKQRPTKRVMLRVIMSIFDIFGFLSPFTTQGKVMLQDTWHLHIDWDDIIPDELYKKWCSWLELLKVIGEIRLPRWLRCRVRRLNVADIATRDTFNYQSFLNEWFKGPEFLYSDETCWPANVLEPENEVCAEACMTVVENSPTCFPVPDPERFSSWLRFLRSTACVLKFVNKCRGIALDDYALMEQAKQLILRQAQEDSFASDIQVVKAAKDLPRDSRLRNLSPYLDENNVLRVSGRIDAASDVRQEAKRPIILDGRHPTTKLLVKHYHVKAAHGHQEAVVNDLKQEFWIIQLRPTVKNVASRCMLCRLRKATPQVPRMGDLPQARMAHHQRAFTFCGIDLFGPMEVTVGRRREKRYGVTCLTVRAVHIEVIHSLTTDSVIMALRRMASRRGWPSHIYSDNGTNLRGADVELRRSIQELDEESLRAAALNNQVLWTFIPPASPHWGGAWERLIRTVKRSLRVILKERAPRDETLSSLLAEVEGIVNGRPLTHVSVEPGSSEALTPNHFLIGSSSRLPVHGVFDDSDLALRKQWRIAQRLSDMYWKRWMKEFLPLLLPRKKWQQEQKPLSLGDLVLVVDPDSPRNVWPRGLIKSVLPGKDGRIRVVDISTATGVLRRSVARVAPVPLAD